MSPLPIYNVIDELLAALQSHQQVVLQAPPGAGKSTALPLVLLQQPWLMGKIVMLEPRRLAARNVATRLAQQLQQRPGQTVGYRMRADSCVGKETRLEVITEGILTRKLQQDPLLEGISLIILDEFHERSLQTDLALTLLLDIQHGLRDDLKILIMSATLDNNALSLLLTDAPTVYSDGRIFPVERAYIGLEMQKSLEDNVVVSIGKILSQRSGSVLVFLPGVSEIKRVAARLHSQLTADIDVYCLYGALALSEQQQAIQPSAKGRRKVVLATNIAETSLTIEGVDNVLDSTLERVAIFDVRSGLTRLETQRISKASMTQRAGRAGRLAPGLCWHLISKESAERAVEQSEPEILRSDLTSLWLNVLSWGCRDSQQLTWLTVPPESAVLSAKRLLRQLNITDTNNELTPLGKTAAQLPCEPRLAAILVYANHRSGDALATAAMLVAIIEEPPKLAESDLCYHLMRPKPHWLKRAKQLEQLFNGFNGRQSNVDISEVPALLLSGYPDRVAKQRGSSGHYQLANGSGAMLDEHDELNASEWLIIPSLLQSELNSRARVLLASQFDVNILQSDFPHLLQESIVSEWHEGFGTLKIIKRLQLGKIVLRQNYMANPSAEQLKSALLSWIADRGIDKLNWDEAAIQLRTRLRLARDWLPEYDWTDLSDVKLEEQLSEWLLPLLDGIHDIRGLRSISVREGLDRLLSWEENNRLNSLLPVVYQVPTGSVVPISYSLERPPTLCIRMQEMFGEQESPKIAQGRITVALELLSPANRPLQITSDLKTFWAGSYHAIKKEMRGRYPKHIWPDDPAKASPTKRTKKHQRHLE